MTYQVFYWLHVIFYIAWLLAFGGSLFYGFKVRAEKDALKKRRCMRYERLITSIGGHFGALGILVSGSVLASLPTGPQWGWFKFQLYPWLSVKQILFLVIILLIGFSIKRSIVFKRRLQQEKGVPGTDTSEKWAAAYRLSMVVYILVVVNTVLGLTKPF